MQAYIHVAHKRNVYDYERSLAELGISKLIYEYVGEYNTKI